MRRKDQKYIIASKLMGMRMKKGDQKCINARKLIRVKIKKGKTQPIMIMIDIFLFFLP